MDERDRNRAKAHVECHQICGALAVSTYYGFNMRSVLSDSVIRAKARELVELVANNPGTPRNVREEILGALNEEP